MIASMTGFGAGRACEGEIEFSVELRTVNHKFCEIKVRMPYELNALETEVARYLKARIARGSVEVMIKRPKQNRPNVALVVDRKLARDYVMALDELATELSLPRNLGVAELAQVEGVVGFETQPIEIDAMRAPLFAALDEAFTALQAMREREGRALGEDLSKRLEIVREHVKRIEERSPKTVENYRQRLEERISEITRGLAVDPQRLAQEVAFFADKVDVAEELTRLDAHLNGLEKLIAGEGAVGRRMDFLVQEINREVNTIGSKSQSAEIAQHVVSLKAEVERMREQLQNIE